MKTKISALAAVIFFVLGAFAQIWAPQWGLTAMLFGVMCALAAVVFGQQTVLRRLSKHERLLKQVHKTAWNGKAETATYGGSILRRVKQLTDEGAAPRSSSNDQPARPTESEARLNASPQQSAGRAATPEVSNPFTDESLHSMLAPGRKLKVAGVFSPRSLPGVEHMAWIPGDVSASLARTRPESLLIDEQEVQDSALWSSATSGAGTRLMSELIDGVRWAKAHGIPAYLLRASVAPDVHSSALRSAPVVVLPLDAESLEASAGGPQTSLLQELQQIAIERGNDAS
ncbi:MAG: hypothetical protein ACTHZ9_11110 [Leucobacter sp.]